MKNNSNAFRWLLVALFSVLGLGLLTGNAIAQDVQQIGDNTVVVEQETTVESGDSVAGSTVVGVVGGSPTIQTQNSGSGATATSGDVTVVNDATVTAGPSATTTAPAENGPVILSSHGGEAQAQQIGDNNVVVDQETNVSSGDCVAGSTVVGVVGSDAVIQNQNSSTDATCTSGDVSATNTVNVNVGPVVAPPPEEEEPVTEGAAFAMTKDCVDNEDGTWDCTFTITNNGDEDLEDVVVDGGWFGGSPTGAFTAPDWSCSGTSSTTAQCTQTTPIPAGGTSTITYTFAPDSTVWSDEACVTDTGNAAVVENTCASWNNQTGPDTS